MNAPLRVTLENVIVYNDCNNGTPIGRDIPGIRGQKSHLMRNGLPVKAITPRLHRLYPSE